jgi:cytochrome c peroxidase
MSEVQGDAGGLVGLLSLLCAPAPPAAAALPATWVAHARAVAALRGAPAAPLPVHAALHPALGRGTGLPGLAEAEARDKAHAQRLAEAEAADQARKLLAPQGLDTLRAEHDAAQARHAEATHALAQLPPEIVGPASSNLALGVAEALHERARGAAEESGRALQLSRQALATAVSQHEAARQERDALKATLEDPKLQAELDAKHH